MADSFFDSQSRLVQLWFVRLCNGFGLVFRQLIELWFQPVDRKRPRQNQRQSAAIANDFQRSLLRKTGFVFVFDSLVFSADFLDSKIFKLQNTLFDEFSFVVG